MKTLTIRGLPIELHEQLRQRAKLNHRSLNQEIIAELSNFKAIADPRRVKHLISLSNEIKESLSGNEIAKGFAHENR